MTIQQFLILIDKYLKQIDKMDNIYMNDPSWDEETAALDNYLSEIKYYLPYFIEMFSNTTKKGE